MRKRNIPDTLLKHTNIHVELYKDRKGIGFIDSDLR